MTPENEIKKAYLLRYLEAKRDELEMEQVIEQYRLSALPSGISYDGVGGGSSVPHGYETYVAKLDELFTEATDKLNASHTARRQIVASINALPTEAERSVMKMRYVFLNERRVNTKVVGYSLKSFEEIAFLTSYSIDWVWHVHGDALAHLRITTV